MSKATKTVIGGMTILGIAGILCKLIGVLFSIPLTWIIGDDGLGIFQSVFPTYNLLLTVSSAGLPVAVSRMVSTSLAKEDPGNAKKVLKVAVYLLTAMGLVCTIMMIAGSGFLANSWVKDPESRTGFLVIAPCVAIVCTMSAFRGFMQGQQNMKPTAISQLIEQVGKVVIALPCAWVGNRTSTAMGAAGALLGITIEEALALLYMMIVYFRQKEQFRTIPQIAVGEPRTGRSLAKELMVIAVPITISACIVPLAQFVDSTMLVDRMVASGMAYLDARPVYGIFSGLVIRLINIPTALALSIAMSLVPAVSAARAQNDEKAVAAQCSLGIRFAFLVGFPCSIGMSLLSHQIVAFFYAGTLRPDRLQIAGELLSMSSLTVVLFTVVQATSSILQGLGKQKLPMYTLVAGVGTKILMNYVLVGIPGLNIHGGPIASICCYSISMIPNLYFVCKYGRLKFDWLNWVLKPGLASAAMGICVILLRTILPAGRVFTILMVMVGIAVFAAVALADGALTKDDLSSFRRRKRRKA